jgi:hypothetical protein
MTLKYKVGDLFKCDNQHDIDGKQCTDFAEIMRISDQGICYKWLGLGNAEQYSFVLDLNYFDNAVEKNNYQIIPCDSEQQKLAILLKYS